MAGTSAQRKSDLMTTAIVILLLSATGAGIGFSVGALLKPGEDQVGAASAQDDKSSDASPGTPAEVSIAGELEGNSEKATAEAEPENEANPSLRIVPIPAVLTTLAAPEGKWIRLEGSILVEAEAQTQSELLAEKAGEQILTYLRTVRLDQLQGPSGFLALRDDLNETVNALSGGEVRAILIHGLLVE